MQQKFQLEPKQRFNMCGLVGEPGYANEILTYMYCFIWGTLRGRECLVLVSVTEHRYISCILWEADTGMELEVQTIYWENIHEW